MVRAQRNHGVKTRVVLLRLLGGAGNPKTEPAVFDYSRLQIEHLMPQRWEKHWPLPAYVNEDPARQELATAERSAAVDRIGNLTLVTSAFNQGVSNLGWDWKRPELAAQSAL